MPITGFGQGEPDDITLKERWMEAWMTRQPVGTLHLSRFADPIYFLLKPIGWKPNNRGSQLVEVNVPEGFVTDLASIPRVFWSILRPDGEYTYPAIIHDYLYWIQTISRNDADEILSLAMRDFSISAVDANVIYGAVRTLGRLAWLGNARLKATGEKQILREYPNDPRIRWDNWKRRPNVFKD